MVKDLRNEASLFQNTLNYIFSTPVFNYIVECSFVSFNFYSIQSYFRAQQLSGFCKMQSFSVLSTIRRPETKKL